MFGSTQTNGTRGFLSDRVVSDAIRYLILIVIMIGVGYAAGFRFEAGFGPAFLGVWLIVLFGIALTWVGVFIGISVKDVETAQVAGFVWVFPLAFASSLYVPIDTMPSWLLRWISNIITSKELCLI